MTSVRLLTYIFLVISISNNAFSKDLFLTNQVENIQFTKKDGTELRRVQKDFEIHSLIDPSTNASLSIADPAVEEKECEFGDEIFGVCGNLKFHKDIQGFFQDMSGLPLVNDANSIKISVIRYNMHLGGNIFIPFSLLSSEVTGSIDQEKINSLKLLDPEQGKLNLKWSYAGRYHVGEFCKFRESDRGLCTIGVNLGFRYLGLEESKGQNGSESKDVIGGIFEVANAWVFPIYDVEGASKDAGQLAIKISGTYYYQNIDESTVLFPDATDSGGNLIKFQKEYFGYNAIANLSITDKLSFQAGYFKASSHDLLDSETTLAISYDF